MKRRYKRRAKSQYKFPELLALTGLALLGTTSAHAQTFWQGTNDANWNLAGNWNPNVIPGSANEDVVNNTVNGILFNTGSFTINSFNSTNAAANFELFGGALSASVPGTSQFNIMGDLVISGGTLSGFVVTPGASGIQFGNNGNNFIDNLTVNGNMDLASSTGIARVTNGLVLNGTASINNNSILAFQGSQTLSGSGDILFGATGSGNRLNIEGASTLTIGNNMIIHGQNGTIGLQSFVGGTNSLINNGTISADVANGTINLNINSGATTAVTNAGILEAQNGGTLVLNSHVTNVGSGNITVADNQSAILQNGVTLTGGTINNSAGGSFVASNNGNNFLNGVAFNGKLDLATNTGIERVLNGLVLNGTVAINNNSILAFQGDQTLSGSGDILFGATGGGNRLNIEGASTLTIGNNMIIHGQNGTIGLQSFVGGTNALINNGIISADVANGTINLNINNGAATAVTNNNLLEAQNGGTLVLNSHVTNMGSGNIKVADSQSAILQNGVTITNGTINNSAGGSFTASNNGNNFLDGVAFNGKLDLATNTGIERVLNGLVLNGTVAINNNSILAFQGSQTLSDSGDILFGATGSGNRLNIEGASTLTIGNNMIIHGQNGTIGGQSFVGGTNALINNGIISADVSGGTINLNINNGSAAAVSNAGVLEAQNGGTLVLNSHVTNVGSGNITVADSQSAILQNGVTLTGGTINNSAGGSFTASNNGNNFLDGVAFNGKLDLASNTGIERVLNGLVLNGTVAINNNSILAFQGSQTLSGSGDILFGATGSGNRLNIEGASTLTIGNNMIIHGQNGTIGGQSFVGGANSLINNGIVSADVAGGIINLNINNGAATAVTNNNLLEAQNGGTLVLNSHVTNVGSGNITVADSQSAILQNGVTLTGGTINNSAGGSFTASNNGNNFLNGVTINGKLDLATNTGIERVLNGLTLNGTVAIDNNSILAFQGDQTLGGSGDILFGATGSGNRLTVEGQSTLTIGNNMLIHGQNGTIGGQVFVGGTNGIINNGTIAADVAGGTLFVSPNNFTNNNIVSVAAGATVNINSPNFTNFNGSTLTGGTYLVTGTLRFNGANIVNNAANLVLDGPSSQIINNNNGLTGIDSQFASNTAAGSFTLKNGRTLTTPGDFTNAGSVSIQNNSAFNVGGSNYTQTGGTTTLAQAASTLTANNIGIQNGVLTGVGTVNGNVTTTGGSIDPGLPIGTLTVNGNLNMVGGALDIQLGGANQFDQLIVNGSVNLGANSVLDVSLLNGFVPVNGETFTFMDFNPGQLTAQPGSFFGTDNGLNLPNGFSYQVVENNNDDLTLQFFGPNGGGGGEVTPEPTSMLLILGGLIGITVPQWKKVYERRNKK